MNALETTLPVDTVDHSVTEGDLDLVFDTPDFTEDVVIEDESSMESSDMNEFFENLDEHVCAYPVSETLKAYTYEELSDMGAPIATLASGSITLSIKVFKFTPSQVKHIRSLRRMHKNRQSAKRSSDRKNKELERLQNLNEYLSKCSWAWSELSNKLLKLLSTGARLSENEIEAIRKSMEQASIK